MNIMTLAITETNIKEYQVIGIDIQSLKILSLIGLTKDNIVSNGEIIWDIGAITSVEKLVQGNNGNELSFYVDGECKLLEPFCREKFVNILSMISHGKSDFFINEKIKYDIIRVVSVYDIYEKNGKNYIKLILQANSNSVYNRVDKNGILTADGNYILEEILVKDLRWINYWKWAIKHNVYEEKRIIYRKQFNKVYNDKFIVVYRHQFKDYTTRYWVTGLHLL